MPLFPKPSISLIEPGLYIGDAGSSADITTLIRHQITAIVSLSDSHSIRWDNPLNRKLVPAERHLFVRCLDSPTQDLLPELPSICDFIDEMRQTLVDPGNVLVHCTMGISRSATVVAAYLMRHQRASRAEILSFMRTRRPVNPNMNFMDQLAVWEQVEYNVWADSSMTTPKEEYAKYLERRQGRIEARSARYSNPMRLVV